MHVWCSCYIGVVILVDGGSTVKSTLLALLKLPRCAAYAAVLVERLSSLGAVTQAEAARRTMDKARMQYGRGAAHKKKRQLDPRVADAADAADSAKRARLPEPPLVDIKRIPPDKGPEQWPPDLVSGHTHMTPHMSETYTGARTHI